MIGRTSIASPIIINRDEPLHEENPSITRLIDGIAKRTRLYKGKAIENSFRSSCTLSSVAIPAENFTSQNATPQQIRATLFSISELNVTRLTPSLVGALYWFSSMWAL
jgi:hypothetical protein